MIISLKKCSTGKAAGELSLIGFKKDPFYAKVRYALSELPREGYY